jgi:IclR family acetate operon transcriptional repressor
VGTLSRGLDILQLFADRGPELSQTEVSYALGLPLATVHRLTTVLVERGFLEREPDSRRLRLGPEVARLIQPLRAGVGLPELARGQLAALAAETGETANLAVLAGRDIVYLLSESGGRLLTPQATIGMRLPAHCTALGKCLLAYLDETAARAALGDEPYETSTPRTLTTWPALAASLAEIRRAGVSISEEEFEVGLVSIAVPISWTAGTGSGSINVSLPTARARPAFRKELTTRLLAAARAIGEGRGAAPEAAQRSVGGR